MPGLALHLCELSQALGTAWDIRILLSEPQFSLTIVERSLRLRDSGMWLDIVIPLPVLRDMCTQGPPSLAL